MTHFYPSLDRLAAFRAHDVTRTQPLPQPVIRPAVRPARAVNPNHYKVADRERQGEDIAQARNKQKHAENVARRRTEIGAISQKPAAQPGAASPDAAPTGAAKTATQGAGATPL